MPVCQEDNKNASAALFVMVTRKLAAAVECLTRAATCQEISVVILLKFTPHSPETVTKLQESGSSHFMLNHLTKVERHTWINLRNTRLQDMSSTRPHIQMLKLAHKHRKRGNTDKS